MSLVLKRREQSLEGVDKRPCSEVGESAGSPLCVFQQPVEIEVRGGLTHSVSLRIVTESRAGRFELAAYELNVKA